MSSLSEQPFIGNGESGAIFDADDRYRYSLWRRWNTNHQFDRSNLCAFIGLNPSTADETINDPTVARCINFAKLWGFDGMVMLNLFAYRATDPKVMKAIGDPAGRFNNQAILSVTDQVGRVVCCWGVHGQHQGRAEEVRSTLCQLVPLYHLGLTKDGHPKHPLYLRADTEPKLWT